MKKLILFDIDGTLRDERYGIPDSTKEAIQACTMAGHILCLCTGRSKFMIQEDVKALGIKNLIAGGGCYIEQESNVLKDQFFDPQKVQQMKQLLQNQDAAISMEGKQHIFMNQKACDILNAMNRRKMKSCDTKQLQSYLRNEKIQYRNNLIFHQKDPIHKFCLWAKESLFQEVTRILNVDMALAQMKKDQDDGYYEIIQSGCRKADAIETLIQYLGIRQEDTIAFGDGMNDADMLAYCHVGIAMKHSDPRLFSYADTICEDVMEGGIYLELKRRKLIES